MNVSDLFAAVSKVAPVVGVSVGRWDDRATWRIDFAPDATEQQRANAENTLAAFDELGSKKTELSRAIDADAETQRMRHITPGDGMQMVYAEKFAQAQAVHAMGQAAADAIKPEDGVAQFPTLSASVGLEAATLWDCAVLVLAKYTQFAQLSNSIERKRLTGKKAVAAATDVAAAQAAYEAITWTT